MVSLKKEPVLELDDIQGNIVPGFRKDHQHFWFFRIDDPDLARSWIRRILPEITSAAEMLNAHADWRRLRDKHGKEPGEKFDRVFFNLAFTAVGIHKLHHSADVSQFADQAFRLGLAARSEFIGDPSKDTAPGHRHNWLFGNEKVGVDLLLIGAGDNSTVLDARLLQLVKLACQAKLAIIHVDRGSVDAVKPAGHEHFGFRDGVSIPALRGRRSDAPDQPVERRSWPAAGEFDDLRQDFASPGRNLIWPGHVLFGYARQLNNYPRVPNENNKPIGPAWSRNGSLMVYRRLRQDIAAFKGFLENAADYLKQRFPESSINIDRLGAKLVGRWKSGTPIIRSPTQDIGLVGEAANYFRFSGATSDPLPCDNLPLNAADPNGVVCPLAAHVRKVNPRDDITDLGPPERTIAKLIVRRGIPYDLELEEGDDRGLLFVSYQSSIQNQFEFLMRSWIKNANQPRAGAGHDPILAQGPGKFINLVMEGETVKIPFDNNWVIPTGGAYMFAPALSALKSVFASRD